MQWKSYSTEVPGKWVLAGEHTVLRGGSAVALPHPEFKLRLEFFPNENQGASTLRVTPENGLPVIQELLQIAKEWTASRGVAMGSPHGHLTFSNTIPLSAGLGSSAALSVATARWVLSACGLECGYGRELATQMENIFHGKSSGMDVSVISIGEPILFSMKEGAVRLRLRHLPTFLFADTGLRASTKNCIQAVEKIRAGDSTRGEGLDWEMGEAVREALEGLRAYDDAFARRDEKATGAAITLIERGMNRSREVFREWGLIPVGMEAIGAGLEQSGWRNWRLTGSGCGGFLVGLKK